MTLSRANQHDYNNRQRSYTIPAPSFGEKLLHHIPPPSGLSAAPPPRTLRPSDRPLRDDGPAGVQGDQPAGLLGGGPGGHGDLTAGADGRQRLPAEPQRRERACTGAPLSAAHVAHSNDHFEAKFTTIKTANSHKNRSRDYKITK